MGTGMEASGFICPECHSGQRQEVLDLRERGSVARLKCLKCEHVWTVDMSEHGRKLIREADDSRDPGEDWRVD